MVVRAGVAAVQAGLAELRGREAVLVLRGGGAVPPRRAPRPRAHVQDGGGEGRGGRIVSRNIMIEITGALTTNKYR